MAEAVLTIAEQVRERLHEFTATERKAAHVLLATYPLAGLEPVAEFAGRAGVSAPSILRFVARLGFQSYPDFQKRLREELEAQLKSPLMKASFEPGTAGAESRLFDRFRAAVQNNLSETFAHLPPGEFDAVTELMSDPKRRIYLIGGRFTDPLARYLASHLRIVRTRVIHLSGQIENLRDQVLDMRKNDVLVVFDMRRYQADIVSLAKLAASRGVRIVLITDQWLSPISRVAAHILSAHISVPSNWDSNVAPLALVEALLAAVTERLWPSAKTRIAEIEKLRPEG
ncbi:MurR/RpiR family transcriptional regulator [Microbaculum marinum]|uniref:MurR/RpiR family transcriptional regulator n=1 Tax=Microbaculum marinum TaxID=1764581 RepID=A0AAW9RWU9_9HYPH